MVIKNVFFITSAASPSQFIKSDRPIIAVVGKSNVGKSSFINMLAERKNLARTSDTPGRTRLINYFDFGEFILADLPGYGYAKVSKEEKEKWGRTMEAFFNDGKNCDFVVSLLDIRHDPTADDLTMINYLHANAYSYFFVATKSDKLPKSQIKQRVKGIADFLKVTEYNVIPVSSVNKTGKNEVFERLWKVISALKDAEEENE